MAAPLFGACMLSMALLMFTVCSDGTEEGGSMRISEQVQLPRLSSPLLAPDLHV